MPHQAPQVQRVEQALLDPVGELGEVPEVGEDVAGDVPDVTVREPDRVDRADHEVVGLAEDLLIAGRRLRPRAQ